MKEDAICGCLLFIQKLLYTPSTASFVTRAPSPRSGIHPFVIYLPYPPYIICTPLDRTNHRVSRRHKPNAWFHTTAGTSTIRRWGETGEFADTNYVGDGLGALGLIGCQTFERNGKLRSQASSRSLRPEHLLHERLRVRWPPKERLHKLVLKRPDDTIQPMFSIGTAQKCTMSRRRTFSDSVSSLLPPGFKMHSLYFIPSAGSNGSFLNTVAYMSAAKTRE